MEQFPPTAMRLADIIVPHDPSSEPLSQIEKLTASQRFREMVDDALLQGVEHLPVIKDKTVAFVEYIIRGNQGTTLQTAYDSLENGDKVLRISEFKWGKLMAEYRYEYKELSGEVTRWDESTRASAGELMDMSHEAIMNHLHDHTQSRRLEERLGYDGQAVGQIEIEKLGALMTTAEVLAY